MSTFDAMTHPRELVVLVHGLLMPGAATVFLARRLRAAGFDTRSFAYPSVRGDLEDIAARLARAAAGHALPRVHFVGHSLGGLVLLTMLHRHPKLSSGRVVLLGSPCTACGAADQLSRRAGWRLLIGRVLPAWRVQDGEVVVRRVETGMIAGTRRVGLGRFLVTLEGANDGMVTVAETRLRGLADHLVMPVSHSGMLVSARVAHQVAVFLRTGRFDAHPV